MPALPHRRKGFTLIETLIVSGLMAMLAMLLASTWALLGGSMLELIARGRLVQERDLAVAALARDLGGSPNTGTAANGTKQLSQFQSWQPLDQGLEINYAGDNGSTTVIRYMVDSNSKTLVRYNGNERPGFTVAGNVESMAVTFPNGQDHTDPMRMLISFRYRGLTLTCDLTAKKP
jgi:prepilin-type N-terminal cleavage/methylation domain-containing protein